MSKVGFPGADVGFDPADPTIAELLKPLGYATGQFGKNHLGDLNKFLPTVHGFDEFFGNLYHLNAEEEPELPDFPGKDSTPVCTTSSSRAGSCTAGRPTRTTTRSTAKYGPVGKQRIEDTGPLTQEADGDHRRRDDRGVRRLHPQAARGRDTVLLWMNMTHMHLRTHTKPESLGQAGSGSRRTTTR